MAKVNVFIEDSKEHGPLGNYPRQEGLVYSVFSGSRLSHPDVGLELDLTVEPPVARYMPAGASYSEFVGRDPWVEREIDGTIHYFPDERFPWSDSLVTLQFITCEA